MSLGPTASRRLVASSRSVCSIPAVRPIHRIGDFLSPALALALTLMMMILSPGNARATELSVDYWSLADPEENNLIHGTGCVRISGGGLPQHTEELVALGYNQGPNGIAEEGEGDDLLLGPLTASWVLLASAPEARTGTKAMADSPTSNYASNQNRSLTWNGVVDLSGAAEAKLIFYHHYHLGNGDYLDIEVDAGAGWLLVERFHSLPGDEWLGGIGNYKKHVTDLGAYVGESIGFRFHFHSDANFNRDGWFMDDLRLEKDGVPLLTETWEAGAGNWTLDSFWGLTVPNSFQTNVGSVDSGTGVFTASDHTGVAWVQATYQGENKGLAVKVVPPDWIPGP